VLVSARDVRSPWAWFVAWLVVGAGLALGVLGAFSIGIFVLPVVVAAAGFLVTRRGATRGLPGLVSGIGTPLFYVAYLNRDGPGTVCTTFRSGQSCINQVCTALRGGQSCTDELSPWPWLYVGALLLLVGVAAFIAGGRTHDHMAPFPY
jgi:hypothetical protein